MISISIEVDPHQIVQMQIFPVHHSQQTRYITSIYNGYSQYIPCICRPPPHIPRIYLVYTKWVCSGPLFIMICQ
jgi:hypothetical protein